MFPRPTSRLFGVTRGGAKRRLSGRQRELRGRHRDSFSELRKLSRRSHDDGVEPPVRAWRATLLRTTATAVRRQANAYDSGFNPSKETGTEPGSRSISPRESTRSSGLSGGAL